MRRHSPYTVSEPDLSHAPLWLAASEGRRLRRPTEFVADISGPEIPMEIEFFGIAEAEQRAALRGFPGGRRFVLVGRALGPRASRGA